jgi:hypothetical protein
MKKKIKKKYFIFKKKTIEMTNFRYDERAIRALNALERELLSQETLVPPKKKPKAEAADSNFAKYHNLLREIAVNYAMHTPREFPDKRVERDYLTIRLKIYHRLDMSPPERTADETEEECARKLALLEKEFEKMKVRTRL